MTNTTSPSPTYFYNEQIANYLLQFIRIFGNFQVKTGTTADGADTYITVPVRYSDMSRQVANILQQNSTNIMLSCPFMTCHITGIGMASDRRQDPNFVGSVQVNERFFEADTQEYNSDVGQQYSIERYMPVPYTLSMELDIWTSNTNQKLQLFEQILVLFNPSLDLQTSINPIDWSALTNIELEDSITWSEKGIPAGTEDTMDIAKLSFKLPIWLNPPAKIKKQHIINNIITNLHNSKSTEIPVWNGDDQLIIRSFITIKQYMIKVENNIVTLLGQNGSPCDDNGKPHSWANLLERYGHYRENVSQLQLKTTTDMRDYQTNIIGTIQLQPHPNKLIWTCDTDTLPLNTIPDISSIIDPSKTFPSKNLPAPATGQRYLLLNDIAPCNAWGNLFASQNDIIEYNGQSWEITFCAAQITTIQYVKNGNQKSLKQFKWTGQEWTETLDGEYYPGFWWLSL